MANSGFMCLGDTIIIDGITIGVEVVEEPEDSVLVETVDSIPEVKKENRLNLNFGANYKYGIGSASIFNENSLLDVDDFIEDSSVPLRFQSFSFNSEIVKTKNSSLQIGISHTKWNQRLTQVESEVQDSTINFYSSTEPELFQVTRVFTGFGFEFDTLEMQLSESVWKQRYIEMSVTYFRDLSSSNNDLRFSLCLSAIQAYSYTFHVGFTTLFH